MMLYTDGIASGLIYAASALTIAGAISGLTNQVGTAMVFISIALMCVLAVFYL